MAVKLQTLPTVDWHPNSDELALAPSLKGLIPAVYGCFEVEIGPSRCSALVVQAVSSTVQTFFDEMMRAPLTKNSFAVMLDVLIETLKQMCVYAGFPHAFRLGDWHAYNLGMERKRVYLIDWEDTRYSPMMTAYRRISPAMKTFLKWIPEFQPAKIQEDVGFRTAWMRLLEKIQQHLGRWWRTFHGGDLPTPSQLDTLLSELCDVAKDLPIELGCSRDLGFCDEKMEVGPGCLRDHPGTTRGPSIYLSMKECLREMLHTDKRNTVEFVKNLALDGLKTSKNMRQLMFDQGGSLWDDVFIESLAWCTAEQRGSITASEILCAVDDAMKDVDGDEPRLRESKDPLDAPPPWALALLESMQECLRQKLRGDPDDAFLENVKFARDCLSEGVRQQKTMREFMKLMK
ncbi:MAG: hypothetical protein MK077_10910, partial [Phycisphaerales bacterium]|nr:hypothetical protein [Phycisphaerales bacterium]